MKQTIRLTESELKGLIKQCLTEEIDMKNSMYAALSSDRMKSLFIDMIEGRKTPEEVRKQMEIEQSWQALKRHSEDGKVNQIDAEFNRNMYDSGYQHRIAQHGWGVNNPYGLPNENPNLFDNHHKIDETITRAIRKVLS